MIKLLRLELKRNHIRTYAIAAVLIAAVMLGFLYLFAYAPMLEPDDRDMVIFSGYRNLIPLFSVMDMAVSCVLSAVMYSKFIIEEYAGKRAVLLFSYPISRKKMMLSKLCVVSIFTIVSMVLSSIVIFLIFGISEQAFRLVDEEFTVSIMLRAVETAAVLSIAAAGIGIAAAGIGFMKKSVPATIVSAVVMGSFLCNIVVNAASSKAAMYAFAAVMLLVGISVSMLLMHKAHHMEVE